jgi:hypothetical protein
MPMAYASQQQPLTAKQTNVIVGLQRAGRPADAVPGATMCQCRTLRHEAPGARPLRQLTTP